jgi:hypothetical protein
MVQAATVKAAPKVVDLAKDPIRSNRCRVAANEDGIARGPSVARSIYERFSKP